MAETTEENTNMDPVNFKDLGLSDAMLRELAKKGFEEPTDIQKRVIPLLLQGEDNIAGQAQTGTGKTGAFGIPLVDSMDKPEAAPRLLILTPTRELAVQISDELNSYKGKKKIQILPIYGGQSISDQIKRLADGVDIIAGTPGRILDHIERKTLKTDNIRTLVIDEADEMLHIGFIEEMESIIKALPEKRRTLLFSATMPESVTAIAKKYMKDFRLVRAAEVSGGLTDQIYFEVNDGDKFEALCRILDIERDFYGMIFCRTRTAVDELAGRLADRGYGAEGLHGDFSQAQRERTLEKFKKRRINILVASDVAARGIDIMDLSHVINYSLPQEAEAYIHRIGRTGRAGKKGVAVTFITPSEYKRLANIEKAAGAKIRRERIPKISDVVAGRLERINVDIDRILAAGAENKYLKIAQKLLSGRQADEVLSAVIKYAFESELDESKYREIKESISVDKSGITRLFVSLGRKDGFTAKKLLKMINNETKVPAGRIRNVRILDSYSFLSVGFQDGETILRNFKREKNGAKPALIKKANEVKPKKSRKNKQRTTT